MPETFSLKEAAELVGVSPSTLKRWADAGLIPGMRGGSTWTPAAVAHARIVARLRERGHSLEQIRRAGKQGRLAYAYIEALFGDQRAEYTLRDASSETGLEPGLIERFWTSIGLPAAELESLSEDDVEALHYAASVLAAGFPVVAFLQLCRVYGQALSQIADAEVRLFHIYVHEPLMREGVPGLQMAEEMEGLARDLLPITSPSWTSCTGASAALRRADVVAHGNRARGGLQRGGPGAGANGDRLRRLAGTPLHRGGGW